MSERGVAMKVCVIGNWGKNGEGRQLVCLVILRFEISLAVLLVLLESSQ
jgi:hypothetical protein